MLTRITPTLAVAYCTSTHSALLGLHIPTRSPGSRPRSSRPRAKAASGGTRLAMPPAATVAPCTASATSAGWAVRLPSTWAGADGEDGAATGRGRPADARPPPWASPGGLSDGEVEWDRPAAPAAEAGATDEAGAAGTAGVVDTAAGAAVVGAAYAADEAGMALPPLGRP